MKIQLFAFLLFLLLHTALQAQAPAAFSYQAVARDMTGKALSNQTIALQVTLYQQSIAPGAMVFQENHTGIKTNQFGLFTAEIGRGEHVVSTNTLEQVNWAQGPYFLEIDITAGITLTADPQELLSVPYALYAERSHEEDGDPANELQTIQLVGNVLTLSHGGGSVTLPGVSGTAYVAGAGIQITGATIINTGDTDPANDITNTTPAGGSLTGIYPNPQIAPNGATNGQVLKWNGTAWLPADDGGNDNWGTQVAQTTPVLTGNGTTAAPLGLAQQGAITGQILKWNGTTWLPTNESSGGTDNWGNQVAQTTVALTGNGTTTALLGLAQQGASTGQILKWNGTAWLPADDGGGGSTYTAGSGITINNGSIQAIDPSPTNELQTLTYDSVTQNLSILNGNTIQLNALEASLWKILGGMEMEPKNSALGVNIPSGLFRGGGAQGWEFNNGGSTLYLFKPSGNSAINVALGGTDGLPNNGGMSFYNQLNNQVVYLHADNANAGRLVTRAADGATTTGLFGHGLGNASNGEVHLFSNNSPVASLIGDNGVGNLLLRKSDGKTLVNANQSALDTEGGAIRVYSNDQPVARLYAESGHGSLLLSGPTGNNLVSAEQGLPGTGSVAVWGPAGGTIGDLNGCEHGVGFLRIYSPTGSLVAGVAHTDGAHLNNGFIGVYNQQSAQVFTAVAGLLATDSQGIVFADELNGQQLTLTHQDTIWHTTIWKNTEGGQVLVRNNIGEPRIDLRVENDRGIVVADTFIGSLKNFRMDHPSDPTKDIYYACVEGPEAAAYERGTGQLQHGEVFIGYSEHFGLVINPGTVTIQLTSHSTDTYGLAVVEKKANGFVVRELKGGQDNFTFDWEVKGVRKGYENYQVIRSKSAKSQPTVGASATTFRRDGHSHK